MSNHPRSFRGKASPCRGGGSTDAIGAHVGRRGRRCAAALLALGVLLGGSALPVAALAQTIVEDGVVTRKEAAPKRLNGIEVEEHLDRALPLTLDFVDTSGQRAPLSRFVTGERPVIFTLNYSDCPMLCSLQLNALAAALAKLDRKLGHDFDVVTVSLNPCLLYTSPSPRD